MASKKAASMRPKAKTMKISEEENKAYFDDAKEGLKVVINAAIRNCDRIDNLVDTWQEMKNWGMDPHINEANAICEGMKVDYENALDVVNDLKFEDFVQKDMEDPILPFIPDRHSITTIEQMYDAYTTFRVFRPIGEKLEQIHMVVYDNATNEVPF